MEEILWPVPAEQAFACGFGAKKDQGTEFSVLAAREMEPEVAQAHYGNTMGALSNIIHYVINYS